MRTLTIFLLRFVQTATAAALPAKLTVCSKRFTESYLLAEFVRQRAETASEARATHHQGLGNTAIVFGALTGGAIDVYPEYAGTIAREFLKLDTIWLLAKIDARLIHFHALCGIIRFPHNFDLK
ncbi:MAG: hypothetical protein HY273_15885 [Gammaproteobacteria bacterium]|nr:hypothetical protein [Gammaproteobacteria bacterium]